MLIIIFSFWRKSFKLIFLIEENKELNASRKKKEKERIHSMMEKMVDEQKRQREHVERVLARLRAEKDMWFLSRSAKLAKNETITTFLQLFVFPRCIFTATDAIYCAKFVHVIHMLKTPNFSTLICFDRVSFIHIRINVFKNYPKYFIWIFQVWHFPSIFVLLKVSGNTRQIRPFSTIETTFVKDFELFQIFCDITYTVTSCTENEADRYGRFLAAMLEIVMKWHKSKEVFEKECVGYPGFVTKFRVTTNESGEKETDQADKKNSGKDHVDYENYRHVVHKWHFKIAKALVVCLESKDYVQIRNALAILTKILPYFPVITKLNGVIEKRIEKVCNDEKDSRKDIYNKALSYSAQLKKRKHLVMKEHEFHQVAAKPEDLVKKDNEENKSSPALNSKKEPTTKESIVSSSSRDSSSRSQSREKSLSRSERETSEDRKARRERESKSRDRSLASKVSLIKQEIIPQTHSKNSPKNPETTRRTTKPTKQLLLIRLLSLLLL